ncbi:MAG TPA: hypothetical protein VF331_08375 [Polyangiales bacterium]
MKAKPAKKKAAKVGAMRQPEPVSEAAVTPDVVTSFASTADFSSSN